MDEQGYRDYLASRNIPVEQIQQHVAAVRRLETFLDSQQPPVSLENAGAEEVSSFISSLTAQGDDSYENLLALVRYAYFSQNRPIYLAVLELLDGAEVMGNLYHRAGEVLGEQERDELFRDLPLPSMGIPNKDKAVLMRRVMDRLGRVADEEKCTKLFADSLRDLPESWYAEDKKRYQEIGDLDAYIAWKRDDFIANLERLRDEGQLFFNQPVIDEMIEFVRADPEISVGVRQGDILYVTKIPYLVQEYLHEPDPEKKRYFFCHCPWARESLRQAEGPVPARFCQCSAGFHKKPWEVIFEQPLQAEVLESVLQGDLRCRFAIHLPL